MKSLRYFVIAAAAGLAHSAGAGAARANDYGCPSCGAGAAVGHGHGYGAGHGGHASTPTTLAGAMGHQGQLRARLQNLNVFNKPNLPVFQAAPWYNYWPYDGHFLTPAPISGPFYGPPLTGNFPVNPYFPGPAYPTGPVPGGLPPAPGGR